MALVLAHGYATAGWKKAANRGKEPYQYVLVRPTRLVDGDEGVSRGCFDVDGEGEAAATRSR